MVPEYMHMNYFFTNFTYKQKKFTTFLYINVKRPPFLPFMNARTRFVNPFVHTSLP